LIFTKFLYFEGFRWQNLLGSLEFLSVKVSSSEYLLLAVVVEVAVRTVTLPYLTYCYLGGAHVCWFCSVCCWSL